MADWSTGAAPTPGQQQVLDQPFDPSGFTTVLTGSGDDGTTWELRDGPHALLQDPDAVGSELVVTGPRGRSRGGGVGPRMGEDVVHVGGSAADGPGHLSVRCRADVAAVTVDFGDGAQVRYPTTVSPSTGERWVVVALAGPAPVRVRAAGPDGADLASREVADPRVSAARHRHRR